MDNACRICMVQQSATREFFQPITQEIIEKVEFCTGVLIKQKQGIPFHLCSKCMLDIRIAHDLKTKCLESEKSFEIICRVNSEVAASYVGVISLDCDGPDDDQRTEPKKINRVLKRKKILKKVMQVHRETVIKSVKNSQIHTSTELLELPDKSKMLCCEHCQIKFADKKEFMEHKKEFHKNNPKWICEVCGKLYAHRSSQIAHRRSHYPERHKCNDCDYNTHNKYDLIKHVQIHIGDKSFKCAQCPAAYRTSSNLRAHVRARHELRTVRRRDSRSVKRHGCDICGKRFTKRVYMKNHLLKKHEVVIPNVRPGRPRTDVLILNRSDDVVK